MVGVLGTAHHVLKVCWIHGGSADGARQLPGSTCFLDMLQGALKERDNGTWASKSCGRTWTERKLARRGGKARGAKREALQEMESGGSLEKPTRCCGGNSRIEGSSAEGGEGTT